MGRSENLYHLQRIDSQLDEHQRRLKQIKTILNDDRIVRAAKADTDSVEGQLAEAQKQLLSAKAHVQNQRARIKESETTLYSGSVRNPKELTDIQNEVAALKRYLDIVEERQLESMLEVDAAQEKLADAQARLDRALADSESRNAELIEEKSSIDAAVAKLDLERQNQVSEISADDRALYEKLRAKRAGVAVAKVQDRNCTACGSTLASALYQQARSPSKISHCDTCERILYAE